MTRGHRRQSLIQTRRGLLQNKDPHDIDSELFLQTRYCDGVISQKKNIQLQLPNLPLLLRQLPSGTISLVPRRVTPVGNGMHIIQVHLFRNGHVVTHIHDKRSPPIKHVLRHITSIPRVPPQQVLLEESIHIDTFSGFFSSVLIKVVYQTAICIVLSRHRLKCISRSIGVEVDRHHGQGEGYRHIVAASHSLVGWSDFRLQTNKPTRFKVSRHEPFPNIRPTLINLTAPMELHGLHNRISTHF